MAKKIAVFASGNGSNFQVIAEQFPVEFVFSDHRDAYVLERAEKLGVLSYAFELKEFESKADYEGAIVELLDEHQIDLVCLAGYMKIVGPTLLAAYEGRIINIHPAFLPEFPGAHGIEDAWNAGVDQSGVTIHWVDSGVDTGKVIKQVRVPRFEGDTLDTFETRIHEAEYKLYPEVLEHLGVERKFEYKLKNWDKTVDDYNPWKNAEGVNLINEFINCLTKPNNEFSWIEPNRKKYKPATRYIIPTHVQGDYENANLYICLFNPGVAKAIWNLDKNNLNSFIKSAQKEKYIKRMFQGSETWEKDDVIKKIVQNENIIDQEIKIIYNNFEKRPSFKELKQFINSECYYIRKYYAELLGKNRPENLLVDKAVAFLVENLDWGNKEKYLKLDICNLELVPFASLNKKDIKLSDVDEKFTNFTVSIILKRISNYLKNGGEKPVFVFRSRKEWFERINIFINSEFVMNETFDIENSELIDYFYEFSSQNAVLSRNNILKARRKIREDEFNSDFLGLFK